MTDSAPSAIAVLQLGRLGDMILTTPLLAGIRQLYPESKLTVIADEASSIIAGHHPAVDRVLPFRRGFLHIPRIARHIFQDRYQLYIDPKDHRSTTSRIIAELVRGERKIVHPSNIGSDRHALPLPAVDAAAHYVDLMLAPLRLLAPDRTFSRRPSITIPSDILERMDERINPGERGMVVVNISAGDHSRYWEPEKWEMVIDRISGSYHVGVISSPADRSLADDICTTRRRARTIPTASILEAAAVIARSVAVISPDTSIIHLASSFNKPTLGLYPRIDWNMVRFAPLADRYRIVGAPEGGAIRDIEVEEVMEAFEGLMR